MSVVPIMSPELEASEVSWFAPLCSDDFSQLACLRGVSQLMAAYI